MLFTPPFAKLVRLFYITTFAYAYAAFSGLVSSWVFDNYFYWPVIQYFAMLLILAGALIYLLSFITAPLTILGLLLLARANIKRKEFIIPSPKTWIVLFSMQIICTAVAWASWAGLIF